MTGPTPFRPVQHYTPGGAAMVDAIERLQCELAAVRADLVAILPLLPGITAGEVIEIQTAPAGDWFGAVVRVVGRRLESAPPSQRKA